MAGGDFEIAKRILAQRLIHENKYLDKKTFDGIFADDLAGKIADKIDTLEAFTALCEQEEHLNLSTIIKYHKKLDRKKDKTITFFNVYFKEPSINLPTLEQYLERCKMDVNVLAFVLEQTNRLKNYEQDLRIDAVITEFLKLKTISNAIIVFDAWDGLTRQVLLSRFVDLSIKFTNVVDFSIKSGTAKVKKLVEMTTDNQDLDKVLELYKMNGRDMERTRKVVQYTEDRIEPIIESVRSKVASNSDHLEAQTRLPGTGSTSSVEGEVVGDHPEAEPRLSRIGSTSSVEDGVASNSDHLQAGPRWSVGDEVASNSDPIWDKNPPEADESGDEDFSDSLVNFDSEDEQEE
jgi:hypothetical protein